MKNAVLEILVPSGIPTGLRVVKLAGWIGKAFIIPRADLKEIKDYRESLLPGVYFLFGETDDEKPTVYIGQTDKLLRRLSQQDVGKDDWDVALVFTGEADVDVLYLEKKIAIQAREASRYTLLNSIDPSGRSLSDFRQAVNDDFFDKIKFVTTLLGFKLFQGVPEKQQVSEIYFLEDVENKDAKGKGTLLPNGEFVVFSGSLSRVREAESFLKKKSSIALRRKLVDEGVLRIIDNKSSYIFNKDYVFSSPSSAADTVLGRSCNGWTGWKDSNGLTLDQRQRQS